MEEGICRRGAQLSPSAVGRCSDSGGSSGHFPGVGEIPPRHREQSIAQRGGSDPYGQTLPPWLTYTTVTMTIDGQVTISEGVENLPQTYYGPSIPLGPGWVYGGTTSPVVSVPTVSSSMTTSTGTLATPSRPVSSLARDSSGSNREVESTTASTSSPTTPMSRSSSRVTEKPTSETHHSSSLISPSTTPSPLPLGTSTAPARSLTASSRSPSSTAHTDIHHHLVPLLPALLVPILLLLLLCLLGTYIYKRQTTYQPSTISPSPPPWLPRRLVPILYPRIGYAPPPLTPSTPQRRAGLPLDSARSPDEKSALLTGFTPHHHRQSSSLSALASLTGHPGSESTDQVADLPAHHPSMLQRLTLGLGLFSSPTAEPRRPSGFTLEKGLSPPRYTAIPLVTHHSSGSSGAAGHPNPTVASTKPSREGVGGSGQDSSSGHFRSIPDDQLFFKSPTRTVSSRNTSSGSGGSSRGIGPSRGWKSRFDYASIPGDAGPLNEGGDADQVSLAVPETPGSGSLVDDVDLGEFGRPTRWSRHDRMSFPKPPATSNDVRSGATRPTGSSNLGRQRTEQKQRQSLITVDSGSSFQTAHSDPAIPPPAISYISPGAPISRDDPGYRHASLSAFGSHPSTPAHSLSQTHSSSQGDVPEGGLSGSHAIPVSCIPSATSSTATPSRRFSALRGSISPPRINVQRANELIKPLQDFFRLSPPSTAGLSDSARSGVRHSQRSFPGEPLVDMRLTAGSAVEQRRKGVGEFGEPLRPSRQRSLGVIAPLASAEVSSETASVYSQPSGMPTEPRDGSSRSSSPPALSGKALRGRRSQQQLLRADEVGERPLPPIPSSAQNIKGEGVSKSPARGKGWFGKHRKG